MLDEGKTIPQVARDLDLTESALRTWVERTRADRTQGKTGLTTVEREELARLRKENRELRMEREILKKAAVGSAGELGDRFETHPSAKAELFDYIEVFYNQERRHSTLGYLSPAQFERAARMEQAAA